MGVKAVVLGMAFLIGPLFVGSPALQGALGALRGTGWLLLVAGIGIVLAPRLISSVRGAAVQPAAPIPPLREPVRRPAPAAQVVDRVDDDVAAAVLPTTEGPRKPLEWAPEVFDAIEWRRFEAVCERLFSQAGFETKAQSHGADGGIDIWLHSKNHPEGPVSVVQCKRWSSKPVKVAEVRALLGSMTDKKVKRGIFATTSTFTLDAAEFAKANGIQLLDRAGLLALISRRSPEQQRDLLAVATEGDFWVPTCASCGVKMTRRTPKKGGQRFWGCVNYPRCKTTLNA